MPEHVKLAAVQMVSGPDLEANLASAESLIQQCHQQGAGFVVLPEVFALFNLSKQAEQGQRECTDGPIQQFLARCAKQYACYLLGGTIPIADAPGDSRPYAASLLYDPSGEQIGRYNKIHLFDVDVKDRQGSYRESDSFRAGDKPVCVRTDFASIGMSVCYDLRFPELYRVYFQQGVDILVIPSAFTELTGKAHWMPLLRARAIENSCYVIAADQGGVHGPKRETFGHSCIISPWGEVLSLVEKGEGIAIAEFDAQRLAEVRQQIPVRQHQRLFVADK